MNLRPALTFAAIVLASAGAFAQEQAAAPKDPETSQAPTAEEKAFLESCAVRKFETIVEVTVEGAKRGRKVTVCGKEGQTDTDWISTLKDAASKVEANEKMAPAVKEQIVTALNAEIAKFEVPKPDVSLPTMAAVPLPDIRSDYSTLPPIPEPPKVAANIPAPTAELDPEKLPDIRSDYSTLPPLPEPPKLAANLSSTTAAALKKPRLTIRCLEPGERGVGSTCAFLEPETRLAIRADEDLPGGTSLRFLRKGDARGEVALDPMRQGQIVRAKLPPHLCTGVAKAKVDIQVVGGSQVLGTLGTYGLRC